MVMRRAFRSSCDVMQRKMLVTNVLVQPIGADRLYQGSSSPLYKSTFPNIPEERIFQIDNHTRKIIHL